MGTGVCLVTVLSLSDIRPLREIRGRRPFSSVTRRVYSHQNTSEAPADIRREAIANRLQLRACINRARLKTVMCKVERFDLLMQRSVEPRAGNGYHHRRRYVDIGHGAESEVWSERCYVRT